MSQVISLKNQKEFDAVNRVGKKLVGKFMIVVMADTHHCEKNDYSTTTYLGLKVGRKFGNAVKRNKFKRRIKAIVREFAKTSTQPNAFIIIPKSYAVKAVYEDLVKDFQKICKQPIDR